MGNCVSSSSLSKFVDICQDYLADYVCVPFNDVPINLFRKFGRTGTIKLLMTWFTRKSLIS